MNKRGVIKNIIGNKVIVYIIEDCAIVEISPSRLVFNLYVGQIVWLNSDGTDFIYGFAEHGL